MSAAELSMVVGVFDDLAQVERAVGELRQAGFSNKQLRLASHGHLQSEALAHIKKLFVGRGTTSSVYDDFLRLGLSPQDASFYQTQYEAGRSFLAVSAEEDLLQRAVGILQRYDVDLRQASRDVAESFEGREVQPDEAEERKIQLREEELQIQKQSQVAGEVQVSKRVISEQQTLNVPVEHEEVYIEHHPVAEQVSETPVGEEQTITVPVSEEKVNIQKQIYETGEVNVQKRRVQETREVRDTVRKERAHIEREGDAPIHDTKTDPFHPSSKDVDDLL